MKKLGLLLIWIFTVLVCHAAIVDYKSDKANTEGKFGSLLKESYFIAGYQDLKSTHQNHFRGFNVMAGYNFSPKLSLGIEVEDVFSLHHDDNGWKLSELRLIPVIVDARYLIGENKFIVPFVEVSTGITFLKYYKKVKVDAGSPDVTETDGPWFFGLPFLVKETGLYTYFGAGTYFRISKHFMPFVGIGFKGYKMSFNGLDINPHGINFEIGCKF
ncbi:MAG TPA: hypothetical protein DCL77_00430 [Prolixibacteraceae bacterium]|jgi:hypothetical protein|nr:hypothetical protein [Prolixibacteraceae bacterium]